MPTKQEKSKNTNSERIAFVISPIGEPDTPERKRADQILKHVIEPVVSEFDYKAIRADKISKPGVITSQIIDHIINDPLVIADLTGHNPNVFYELAVRHVIKKPVIQIIREGEKIPFDVSTTRTIRINHQDLDSVEEAKKELRMQIETLEKNPKDIDSPISAAIDLQFLRQSENPQQKAIAELRTMMQQLSATLNDIKEMLTGDKSELFSNSNLFNSKAIDKFLLWVTNQEREHYLDNLLRNYYISKGKRKKEKKGSK